MNIAEKLKDAPKGTKLYSPIIGECELEFVHLDEYYPIKATTKQGTYTFTSEGLMFKDEPNGECMLFPSRDNRDWNNFSICPFKKGDFIVREYTNDCKYIAIFSHNGFPFDNTVNYVCILYPSGDFSPKLNYGIGSYQEVRLATEEEKKKLLDAIERKGYYWDECSMTLKKVTLKFKVGDTIHREGNYLNHIIKSIAQDRYICENNYFLRFVDQNNWNIAKFDINSLKPFDKVLVRDDDNSVWTADFYSYYAKKASYHFRCVGTQYGQCIPYNDETKHLVGTDKECPEYYKTW